MNRRSLLKLLGLTAAASALPAVAEPSPLYLRPSPRDPLAEEFRAQFHEPLFAVAYTRGPKGERYKHVMPASMGYRARVERGPDDLVVTFDVNFTGTIETIEIRCQDEVLCTMPGFALDNPNVTHGCSVRVTIGVSI